MPENSDHRPLIGVQESTLEAFREALVRNGTQTPAPGGELHRAVRQLVVEARSARVPVEHIIIHVKHEWTDLAIVSESRRRVETNAVVEKLVTLCLDEYYLDQ